MKINEMFTSKWLRAEDVDAIADEDTGNVLATIKKITMEDVGEGEKPVVFFHEFDQGLVLNRTNAGTLKEFFGNDTDDWIDKAIYIFTQEVDFKGKQVLAVRIRSKLPKAKTAKSKPVEEEAEIPF